MSSNILAQLNKAVIVSVQAENHEPLAKPECLLAMAQSAITGGAKALRLANPENIRHVKEHMPEIPVIGITKPSHLPADPENHVYITPGVWAAESIIQAGAEIVALDATGRLRPSNETLETIIKTLKERFPNTLLMADVSTEAEGIHAAKIGFDVVGTTLSGYTSETLSKAKKDAPDFELLSALTDALEIPVILEGRVWEPEHVAEAFERGAYAVVIGSAITRPQLITKRFVKAVPSLKSV